MTDMPRKEKLMPIIANDDGKKMVEGTEIEPFLQEYARVTGTKLTLIAAGERPDFACEKRALKGSVLGLQYDCRVLLASEDQSSDFPDHQAEKGVSPRK
jgi:hypothetical protein